MRIPAPAAAILLILLLGSTSSSSAFDPEFSSRGAGGRINSVIGDISFITAFGKLPDHATDEGLRIATHLEYVERLLRSRDQGHLSPELRAERLGNLGRLRAYRLRGMFPRNDEHPGVRRPCFIDRHGAICAVGYLVECSSGREAAEHIDMRYRYAHIADMDSEQLQRWVAASGLTLEEAAMIQPDYGMHEYNRPIMHSAVRRMLPDRPELFRNIQQIATYMKSSSGEWTADTLRISDFSLLEIRVDIATWKSGGGGTRTEIRTEENRDGSIAITMAVMKSTREMIQERVVIYPTNSGYIIPEDSTISRWWTDGRLDSVHQRCSGHSVKTMYPPDGSPPLVDSLITRARFHTDTLPADHDSMPGWRVFRSYSERSNGVRSRYEDFSDARGVLRGSRSFSDDDILENERWFDTNGRPIFRLTFEPDTRHYSGTRYEYQENYRDPVAEVTMRYDSYDDYLEGNGEPVRSVRRDYLYNNRGDWISGYETIRTLSPDGTASQEIREFTRTITYHKR